MQSHRDDDSNKAFGALRELAEKMTARGENKITAGEMHGEAALESWERAGVTVKHLPDDPLALRISIGEARSIADSAYCVFRGDKVQVIALLERALNALRD